MKVKTGISQNKKIAVAAISIFFVSVFVMLFFLGNEEGFDSGHTNLLHSGEGRGGAGTEAHSSTEDASALEKEMYMETLENKNYPVFALYPSGKFKYVSEEFCELVKKDCESLKGKLFYNLINSKDLPDLISAHSEVITSKKRVEAMGPYRMLSGKNEIIVMLSAAPVSEGKIIESIAFFINDITEQVEDLDHYKQEVGKVTLPADNDTDEEVKTEPSNDDWLKVLYPKMEEFKDSKMAHA